MNVSTTMNYTELIRHNMTVRDAAVLHKVCHGCNEVPDLIDDQISTVSVSQITDKLFAKGLIRRCPHPTDRRRYQYFPTPEGKALAKTRN